MKKRTLAGLILFAFPTVFFANTTILNFEKNNISQNDTIPMILANSNLDESSDIVNISFKEIDILHEEVDDRLDWESNSRSILDTVPEILPQKAQVDYSQNSYKEQGNTNKGGNNKGEKLYNNLGYLSSTDHFLKMESEGNLSRNDKEKLANSYRLNGMTEDAEYWYAQIITNETSAETMLHYAEMLQSNGKCEDAARWFKSYAKKSNDKNRTFIENCNELQAIPELEGVTVVNLEKLNTSALDFSPLSYKNGIIFSSTRGSIRSTKNIDKWTNGKFSDLFFAEKNEDGFSNAKPMDGVNGKFHDGTATFNQQGDYMIFTRNSKRGKSKKNIRELKLYESKLEGGKWSKPKGLNINNDEFANCHPTLSQDGKRLYFSSNRPGGYGGMDLYLAKKISGKWTEPQNLGPIVNSSGNEVFPFLHDDEKLYFSSNGHMGVGGLDIFVVEKSNTVDETSWSIRSNLGKPFNSPKDDIGFSIGKDNVSGYLASSRKGGMGKDDIYTWAMDKSAITEIEEKPITKNFCVYDITNNQRIEGVDVSIVSGDFQKDHETPNLTLLPSKHKKNEYVLAVQQEEKTYMPNTIIETDDSGKFNYLMENDQDYFFVLSKKGFETVQHQTDYPTVKRRNEYCIAMAPQSCMTMKGSVVNKEYNRPVPFAEVEIFNRCTGEIVPAQTDEKGEFEMCVSCNCEFEIMAKKDRFQNGVITFSTMESDCQEENLAPAIIDLVLLDRSDWNNSTMGANYNSTPNENGFSNNYQSKNGGNSPQQHPFNNSYSSGQPYASSPNGTPLTQEFLMEYLTGDKNTVITAGQKFVLKNIYYDFDKHNIRPDAGIELDYIVNLMKIKPTIEISMASHTDTRGNDGYNYKLSTKRAEAAQAYLISRGISAARIHDVEGYGESQPVVPCEQDYDCSDMEHQTNRRTEITILKI